MNEYLTHIPISEKIIEMLRKEFYDNVHKAKTYVGSNGIKSRTLEEMEVIRWEDMNDCHIGNRIAENMRYLTVSNAKPRYYRQEARSDLDAHKDLGSTASLNIVLEGSGPITFDNKYEFHYKCALLNVAKLHSVRTEDTRVIFKLSIDDMTYEEVLDCIEGKENDIFDISNL